MMHLAAFWARWQSFSTTGFIEIAFRDLGLYDNGFVAVPRSGTRSV